MATPFDPPNDPGFGTRYPHRPKRILNDDGTLNVKRLNGGFSIRDSYLHMVNISWPKFLGLLVLVYLLSNVIFALFYTLVGIESLGGIESASWGENFMNAFFFSVQTFTTVGYGGISPVGIPANIVASFEAMTGLLGFSIATGLLYGRFSKPTARILFSKNAIIAPHKGKKALQLRLSNMRENLLMEMQAKVFLITNHKEGDEYRREYHFLKLELPQIELFPLNWTLVHVIDETSPFYSFKGDDYDQLDGELMVLVKGFDETFNRVVQTRYSYACNELIWGASFEKAYTVNAEGDFVLDLEDLHKFRRVELPA